MAMVIGTIVDNINYLFYDLADERSRDLFPSAFQMIGILSTYLYFCTKLGPRLMRDIKPFDLRRVIFFYNLFQIYISSYIMYLGVKGGWFNGYSFTCQPIDWTENEKSRTMLNAFWWYTVVKLIDLMDTVFFVLRKKDRQISFLHLFHHFMMPIASFIGMKLFPNGHATFVGFVNCFVHVIMYSYYFIAGLGPKYQKYLWWKKHVTTLQLAQFVLLFFHNLSVIVDGSCGYPKWICAILCVHALQFIYMFGNFYYVNYVKSSKPKVANGTAKTDSEKTKVR
ncbi:very long chain fatty acid elongase 7-like [Anticarsia gemmatalis]|uniref:very long chain fatty acid elongase 7-like n=1 Tax=Anticarsia gemmatalis TaxID=129554 RepID=UPI003F7639DB